VTPPGSPRSQAKAAWTVLPPESWPGRAAGQHLHPGLGGDLLSLPSQQREKRFLELLAAQRAWSPLQPQPRQLSGLVSPSQSCTAQKHLLSLCRRDTAREHVFPGRMPSLLADPGQEAAVPARGVSIAKAQLCPVEPAASVRTRLAACSACEPAPATPCSSSQYAASSFPPLLPRL